MKKLIILVLSIIIFICSGLIVNKVYLYYKDSRSYTEISKFRPEEDNQNYDWYLSSINNDYRFWINIDNTVIDYPVVQGEDNDIYLKHNFNNEKSISGTVFVDYRNSLNEDRNIVIYGHNMRNGSMFSDLNKFK